MWNQGKWNLSPVPYRKLVKACREDMDKPYYVLGSLLDRSIFYERSIIHLHMEIAAFGSNGRAERNTFASTSADFKEMAETAICCTAADAQKLLVGVWLGDAHEDHHVSMGS